MLAIERGATSIAFDIHLEDGGVMDEAIDGGERHRLVGEHLSPFATIRLASTANPSPPTNPAATSRGRRG